MSVLARRPLRVGLAALVTLVALLLGAAQASAEAQWQLEQPAPPAGARFKVPLGRPGDLQFFAPNAGLLSVEGNATVPRGLLFYDGRGWHQLSTVCGDTADTSRVAWASADEFWVVTAPSYPRFGSGLGLCHFKHGAVVGSYSTPVGSGDPFQAMDAAWCNGPSDCWFAGAAGEDPAGARQGSFELHWDGSSLTSSYSPQGRGISAIGTFQGRWYQTAFAGAQREDRSDPTFVSADEPYGPELLRGLGADGQWRGVNYLPRALDGVPADGTDLLALSANATDFWVAGGGAASGPDAPPGGSVARPPVAVRASGAFYQELPLDSSQFGLGDRFVSVAAVPGSSDAWVADQPFADRASTTAKAKVALLHANGTAHLDTLPAAGAGRGSAAKIACRPRTTAGWSRAPDGSSTSPTAPRSRRTPIPAGRGRSRPDPTRRRHSSCPTSRPRTTRCRRRSSTSRWRLRAGGFRRSSTTSSGPRSTPRQRAACTTSC